MNKILCKLYTLIECVWRDSQARVTWDETVQVRFSTILPWTLNPRGTRSRQACTYESENKARSLVELLKITSMCPKVYLILARDTRRQPCETWDPLTRTSQTAKNARANEVRPEHLRLHESIRDVCFHPHSHSRVVSGSLGESVQPV